MKHEKGKTLNFFPGQFGFIRIHSKSLSNEEHPFTIASSPLEKDFISFTIRESGDWTCKTGFLEPGDKVLVSGPFGLFSPYAYGKDEITVFIAGGVGITPFLSYLRTVVRRSRIRSRIILVWSNRTKEDAPCSEEIDRLESELEDFIVVRFYTREPHKNEKKARLDRDFLLALLGENDRVMRFFLCGPAKMMDSVSRILREMGVKRGRIVKEEFKL
jgi:predicted ferric reductase